MSSSINNPNYQLSIYFTGCSLQFSQFLNKKERNRFSQSGPNNCFDFHIMPFNQMDSKYLRIGSPLLQRQTSLATLDRIHHSRRSFPHEPQFFRQFLRVLCQAFSRRLLLRARGSSKPQQPRRARAQPSRSKRD